MLAAPGLQCKRAAGTRSPGLGRPRGCPQRACRRGARARLGHGHGGPRPGRHNRGVEQSGLGRHVDIPERDGAAGGLVPEQQGWCVCVRLRVRSSPALLHAGLCAGAQALGQDRSIKSLARYLNLGVICAHAVERLRALCKAIVFGE